MENVVSIWSVKNIEHPLTSSTQEVDISSSVEAWRCLQPETSCYKTDTAVDDYNQKSIVFVK